MLRLLFNAESFEFSSIDEINILADKLVGVTPATFSQYFSYEEKS